MARNKSLLSKQILKTLLLGGAFILAGQNPYFWLNLYRKAFQNKGFRKAQMTNAFAYLKKENLVEIQKYNHQIYIRLTLEGEKEAEKFQINGLKIPIPRKWDRIWRLIIFDIPEKLKIRREAFRGKLKELGFYQFQKSIWIYPYPCDREIKLLRTFFCLTPKNITVLEVQKIEEDEFLRKHFSV